MANSDKQTIINPPPQQTQNGGGAGWAVAVIILILVIVFLVFGLPVLRRGGININVPDKINVNTNNNPTNQ